MKKLKNIGTLLIAIIVVFSLCVTVYAADPAVTFENGKIFAFAPGSVYTDTDLFDGFKGVMPGDVITETVVFTNNADDYDYVNLYIRAVLHDENGNPISVKVLEELTADERRGENSELEYMKDFLSQLTLKVWKGDKATGKLIYEASPDETDGLSDNKFLGKYYAGENVTLTAELTVPITLGNEYADRIGEVDWVFLIEGFNETQLTVRKIWDDDGVDRPENITIDLLKDGERYSQVILDQDNQWTYTWDELDKDYNWTVAEETVPDGYDVTYTTEGNIVTITNTKEAPPTPPAEPIDLTVKKVWDDDGKDRPDSVRVTLYNGKQAVEVVTLSAENDWTYTWYDLDGNGNWQIIETSIPKGYVPSYSYSNGVITITNTERLIQTGQLNWPIAVMFGLGILFITLGIILICKKKKDRA